MLHPNFSSSVLEAIEKLRDANLDTTSKCCIKFDNGADESILIGSQESLASLALSLLKLSLALNGSPELNMDIETVAGISFKASDLIKRHFDDRGDAWPVCVFLVSNNRYDDLIVSLQEN